MKRECLTKGLKLELRYFMFGVFCVFRCFFVLVKC